MLEAFRRLGLPALLDRSPSPQRSAVLAMVAQRLLQPASKLATTRLWHSTTLPAELALEDADEEHLYAAMDWLLERQDRIQRRLARRHLGDDSQVLYDVSSSYYEGRTCPLMRYGYSRDGKRGRPTTVPDPDKRQISRGKFDNLQRTTAGFTTSTLDWSGLRRHVPTHPASYASYPVLLHRLAPLLHASFGHGLATTPLRFARI